MSEASCSKDAIAHFSIWQHLWYGGMASFSTQFDRIRLVNRLNIRCLLLGFVVDTLSTTGRDRLPVKLTSASPRDSRASMDS